MSATHLTKITTLAKRIRKANPSKKWVDCVRAASKQLKGSKLVGAPKARKKSTPVKKVSGFKKGSTKFVEVGEKAPKRGKAVRVIRRTTSGKPGTFRDFVSIGSVTNQGIKMLEKKLGDVSVKHALATTKRDKRAFAAEKSRVLQNIRKLKSIK